MVGREKKHAPTLADVQEQYLPSVLAQESVTPYIVMLNGEPIGYAQSYVALGSGDDAGRRNRSRSTRNRPVTGECITTGQRLGNQAGSSLGELLFNDPEVTKIQTDPSPSNLRAIRCYEKAGLERQGTVTTPDGPAAVHGSNTLAFERTRSVALTLPSRGTSKGWRSWPPSQTLNIMREAVIARHRLNYQR